MKRIKKIKLGIPRGLLKEQTQRLFRAAGYDLHLDETIYQGTIDDPMIEIFMSRDQELTDYTERGALDAAIAQSAYLLDQRRKVVPIASFDYGVSTWEKARVVLAVPEKSAIAGVRDLAGKKILSRVPFLTKQYLKKHGVRGATIEWTDRPAEPKVPFLGLGDAIVEFSNTGKTLKAFHLKVLDTLLESSPTLFMHPVSYAVPWKRKKMEQMALLLTAARLAHDMTGLLFHAPETSLKKISGFLPALKKPTITPLQETGWVEVLTVVHKKDLRHLLPRLKVFGCTDLVEFCLNKVVL